MRVRIHGVILAAACMAVSSSAAIACTPAYVSAPGDSLFSIAEDNLGEMTKWSLLLSTNLHLAGSDISAVPNGTVMAIPCPVAPVTVEEPVLTSAVVQGRDDNGLQLLTGRTFAPFTGQDLPQNGLITELVAAALDRSPAQITYSVSWDDDWSQHQFPVLAHSEFDMGFPAMKPDCDTGSTAQICTDFLYSEPLMNMPIMLFVNAKNQFQFNTDNDVLGKSICRPAGFFTHDLDGVDRRWISDGLIDFVQGESVNDCFAMVAAGEVDAASVNLFLGASVILDMGLRNTVVPLEKPLSDEGLHVVVSKNHWRATAHLYRINAGLKELRESGAYQEIVTRHLRHFQARLQ